MNDELKISTAEDFRNLSHQRSLQTAEKILLPSGLIVLAYRPGPEWWVRELGKLPKSIAARMRGETAPTENLSPEELVEMSRYMVRMIEEVVLQPKIRLDPGPEDVDPRLVTDADLTYILKYAGGEIAATGQDLTAFPSQRGSVDTGTDGGSVEGAT